jgi:exodeoxyribonuclease-1
VAFPLTAGRNGNVVVYDLRYDPSELIKMGKKQLAEVIFPVRNASVDGASKPALRAARPSDTSLETPPTPRSVIKELQYNRCPAVAPVEVLSKEDGWAKIGLSAETVAENKRKLLAAPDFAERVREVFETRPEFTSGKDPEARLYDGFVSDSDKLRVEAVRNASESELADFNPDFADERLPELLLHFKARNYPKTLSADESKKWEQWRTEHLAAQAGPFARDLQKLAETANDKQQFVLQELQLWFENVANVDY